MRNLAQYPITFDEVEARLNELIAKEESGPGQPIGGISNALIFEWIKERLSRIRNAASED